MSSSSAADDAMALAKEIEGYNSCIAANVALSNAHAIQNGDQILLRVTRTVEDIDNDKKRNYQYILPIPTKDAAPPFYQMPPTEINANIQMEIPTKSGNKMAIVRADDNSNSGNSPARQVLEVWTATGPSPSLIRRIALPTNKQHGKVINDAATFGRPCWSPDENIIVYAAERKKPDTASFFDPQNLQISPQDQPKTFPGAQSTLGYGKSEGWGEQYYQQEALLDFFLVNVETGRIAKVENMPGTGSDEASSSLGSYSVGQPVFSPDGRSLVYTGWDAGGGLDMPKRLGLIYCQQRACKLYSSSIADLLKSISQPVQYPIDPKKEKDPTEKNDYTCLTPNLRLAKSP